MERQERIRKLEKIKKTLDGVSELPKPEYYDHFELKLAISNLDEIIKDEIEKIKPRSQENPILIDEIFEVVSYFMDSPTSEFRTQDFVEVNGIETRKTEKIFYLLEEKGILNKSHKILRETAGDVFRTSLYSLNLESGKVKEWRKMEKRLNKL